MATPARKPLAEPVAGNTLATISALFALYVLADCLRGHRDGFPTGPNWIKHHGTIVGLLGSNRKLTIRLVRALSCVACDAALAASSTGDHIVALANGGPAGIENYLPLCGRCNSSKGTVDLLDWWHQKGRSIVELPADVLTAYTRLTFQHAARLGRLGEPAPPSLAAAVRELAGRLLDDQQRWMLSQRASWISGKRSNV